MADIPIACTLSPYALKTRRDGLLADLFRRAEHHELTEHGLRVRFAPTADVVATVARVVDAERQCCPVPAVRDHGRARRRLDVARALPDRQARANSSPG